MIPDYIPNLPERLVDGEALSEAQLETVIYSGSAWRQFLPGRFKPSEEGVGLTLAEDGATYRKGYFLGDGTGAGKGRQIAGCILASWLAGCRGAIWVSKNESLLEDARRDWQALGGLPADIQPLSNWKIDQSVPFKEGILFVTYPTLRSQRQDATRLGQLLAWAGEDFEGVIAFDESHEMGGVAGGEGMRGKQGGSQQGIAGVLLQNHLPKARVLYASATGASDVNNLAYAVRLGLWGPETGFASREDFIGQIRGGGIAAMEVVSRDLKALGLYQARALSFAGVEYDILRHELSPEQIAIYDAYADAWAIIHQNMEAALEATGVVDDIDGETLNSGAKAAARSRFESCKQRFFNQVLLSMKLPSLIAAVDAHLAEDMSVVNQQRRVHFLLEPGWRADRAIQGLGRTHRTHQAATPVFRPVTTDCKGELRFTSTIARRLDSLGALTRGQRQTGGQNLFDPADNLESEYAKAALVTWFHLLSNAKLASTTLTDFESRSGLTLTGEGGVLVEDLPPIQRWLNRILALPIGIQNAIFDEFLGLVETRVAAAREAGTLDVGVETVQVDAAEVEDDRILRTDERTGATSHLLTLSLSSKVKPMPLARVLDMREWATNPQFMLNANWWLPELARKHPEELAEAILENAQKGDHPLTDVILYYSHFPELMDAKTLEWVLDRFAVRLEEFNAAHADDPDHQTGRLGHPLSFLPRLVHPWQFDCVAGRAGTELEDELVRFATARSGRSSRVRDMQGQECERILAMMAGEGFDALVVSELCRDDPMGREDGYSAALWSEADGVADALRRAEGIEDGGYGQVQQMQALAVHQHDAKLEQMVKEGAPIYVNAAEMRSVDGRAIRGLKHRVSDLLAGGDRDAVHAAARLAGFLKDKEDAEILLPVFVDPAINDEIKQAIIGTFRALQFYDPQVLAVAERLMQDRYDDDGQFVVGYLAANGDADAREAVTRWLGKMQTDTWSSSHYAFIRPLMDHSDSRPATLEFLRRARDDGKLSINAYYVRQMAEEGDERAQRDLWKEAYRTPRFGGGRTVEAIKFLRSVDLDEAFFAAKRLFVRHHDTTAIDLMLDIDREAALPILLDAFRSAEPSLQAEIARRLRTALSADEILEFLKPLSVANAVKERQLAADLAGWMPSTIYFPWLDALLQNSSIAVKTAAMEAIRKRTLEEAASQHLEAMVTSVKPLQWARMQTIFECADPYFLWSRTDPIGLGELLDSLPTEFIVEARRIHRQRSKKLSDEFKKADRDQI